MAWNQDEDDEDLPDDDEDEDPTVPCPHCSASVFDDAERCPSCGTYLSAEDAPPSRKPAWLVVGAVAGLIALLWWMFQP